MSTLTLKISSDGKSVTKDPDPFHAGPPKGDVTIVAVNDDPDHDHELELVKIKHIYSDKAADPLTGPKKWKPAAGKSDSSNHKVKDDADIGRYSYVVQLDKGDLADPEIVVDPPIVDPKKKKKKKAPKKRAAKRKPAKKQSAKKKTAKKKARRR